MRRWITQCWRSVIGGVSVTVVAIGVTGCSDEPANEVSDEPGHVPAVIAQNSSLPADAAASLELSPVAALVDEEPELASTWSRFRFPDEPTVALPGNGVLLFVGTVESGSCPAVVNEVGPAPDGIDADAFVAIGSQPRGQVDVCTDDANPVSFVLSLPDEPLDRVYVYVEHAPRHSGYVDLG